jgi:hypothetical protein
MSSSFNNKNFAPNSLAEKVIQVDNAVESVTSFTYLDAGTVNERISTLTKSSASLGLSYVDTFTYAGTPGFYRVTNITRS